MGRSAPAVADLEAITDYFAERNPDAGIRLIEITARCRQLESHPRQGRAREALGTGIRTVAIFFRATDSGIDVLRVLHGARNIAAEMCED